MSKKKRIWVTLDELQKHEKPEYSNPDENNGEKPIKDSDEERDLNNISGKTIWHKSPDKFWGIIEDYQQSRKR